MIAQQLGNLTPRDSSSDWNQTRILEPQACEAVASTFDVDSKLAAAYRVGVELSRLYFFAIQSFLLDRRDVIERAVSSSGLGVAALRSFDDPAVQDRARTWVMGALSSLRAVFAGGDHIDELAMAQAELRNCLEGSASIENMFNEICDNLERTPRAIVEDLRSRLDQLLGLRERQLMRVGEFVDQLACPAAVGRELLEDAVREAVASENAMLCRLEWSGLSSLASTPGVIASIWPKLPYDASRRPPRHDWSEELYVRWQTAGLNLSPLSHIMQKLRTEIELGGQAVSLYVAEIHALARELLKSDPCLPTDTALSGPRSGCVAPVSCGRRFEGSAEIASYAIEPDDHCGEPDAYLGLRLNRNTISASREGHPAVELRSRLSSFELCLVLLRNRETFTTREVLHQRWEGIGRAHNPSKSTIDDAIHRLREVLKPLGIEIECNKKVGWRLRVSPAQHTA